MPEFLIKYLQDLEEKSERILKDYEDKETNKFYEEYFKRYWSPYTLSDTLPKHNVLAVDGSQGMASMGNGGLFYVVRALAIEKEKRYRTVFADFNYSNEPTPNTFIGRLMEWTEHAATIDAIKDGFSGYVLLDGSIYGRLAHVPLELNLLNSKGFMIEYFETLMELLSLCKEKEIPIIGISKESKTSFFREFLIKEMMKEVIPDDHFRKRLISTALDHKQVGLMEAEKTGDETIIRLIKELVNRKPDSLLIQYNSKTSGYTHPLILGGSQRWLRSVQEIEKSPESYINSRFPFSSEDEEFVENAIGVVKRLPDVPAIVSFHLLPKVFDTPLRVDIPAWLFGKDQKLKEIGWPEPVDIDLTEILDLISSGYCGLENYNIWLTNVDSEVKLRRDIFEELYLNKFEEIIGKYSTARGYRRVRYP